MVTARRRPADLRVVPAEELVGNRERLEFAHAGIVEAADQLARPDVRVVEVDHDDVNAVGALAVVQARIHRSNDDAAGPLRRGILFVAGQRRDPDHLTLEFIKADRGSRIYMDVGRNTPGATFAAPYAVRPKPGRFTALHPARPQ